jgi:mono/diheme cytochrome c family protein
MHDSTTGRAGQRLPAPTALVALVALVALLLGGCSEAPDVVIAEPGEIPPSKQRAGDAVAGRSALLNRAVVTCGLPYSAYVASTGAPAPAYELDGREGRNAELPYQLTAFTADSGVELVTSNCLGCHAAPLNGELVIGLGNEFLDFSGDPVMAVEAAGAFVEGEAEAAEWQQWADRLAAIAPWAMTDTVGANPAQAITLALMAHRDPKTLAWSDAPLMALPPAQVLPVSVPPWWNLGKKHAVFYNGQGRGDHVSTMILASTTCTDTVAEAREIDRWFVDVGAYLATLEPPAYPWPIDAARADAGERVFNRECKECHGRYGRGEHYPNKLVGLDEVGTDPAMANAAVDDAADYIRWFETSFYGRHGDAVPGRGYVAPPLDGVWATAPYLHNGSVPSIAALLDSASRPTYWQHDGAEPDYDQAALGWRYRALSQGREQFASLEAQKWVYDTTRPGYGNQGHDFGDELTAAERASLLEYLKTL